MYPGSFYARKMRLMDTNPPAEKPVGFLLYKQTLPETNRNAVERRGDYDSKERIRTGRTGNGKRDFE